MSFTYEIPLQNGPGKYELVLMFVEDFFTKKHKRLFNIKLGDEVVI